MKEHPLAKGVERIIYPILESLSLELWGIRILTAKQTIVQIFIDSQEGVTVEHCSDVSRRLSLLLDIEEESLGLPVYTLEISTPGVERYFFRKEQLESYIGCEVKVLLGSVEGMPRRIKGILSSPEGDRVIVNVIKGKESKEYIFPWNVVESMQLVYSFNKTNLEE